MKRNIYIAFFVIGVGLAMLLPKIMELATRMDYQRYLDSLETYSVDFTTPQGAILCIEEAYRKKDTEAVVACKAFHLEAAMMLKEMNRDLLEEELVNKTAKTLELAFRKEIEAYWPDFEGLKSYFEEAQSYQDYENVVCVKEISRFPDGGYSAQQILVGETDDGWRMLYPLSD